MNAESEGLLGNPAGEAEPGGIQPVNFSNLEAASLLNPACNSQRLQCSLSNALLWMRNSSQTLKGLSRQSQKPACQT